MGGVGLGGGTLSGEDVAPVGRGVGGEGEGGVGPGVGHGGRGGGIVGGSEVGGEARHGDDHPVAVVAAGVGADVAAVGAVEVEWHVVAAGVELGVGSTVVEHGAGDEEFDAAVMPFGEGFAGGSVGVLGVEAGEQFDAAVVVDGAPVVRVDEAEVPELGALVDVGDAGGGELEELLGERDLGSLASDGELQGVEVFAEGMGGIEQGFGEVAEGVFPGGVGGVPTGELAGFAGGLDEIAAEAVAKSGEIGFVEGPSAEQGLVEQDLFVGIGGGFAVECGAERGVDGGPAGEAAGPGLGVFGEQVEAGAHVFAAFGVMGRGGVHGIGPLSAATGGEVVEVGEGDVFEGWLGADVVEGEEAVVDVEAGVFDAFGAHRGGELLPAADEVAGFGAQGGWDVEVDDSADKGIGGVVGAGVAGAGGGKGGVEDRGRVGGGGGEGGGGAVGGAVGVDVGAIDGQRGGEFEQHAGQLALGDVAGIDVAAGEAGEAGGEAADVGAEGEVDDVSLFVEGEGFVGAVAAGEGGVGGFEGRETGGVDEDTGGGGEEVIAGGAIDRPGWQGLITFEDLFDDDPGVGAEAFAQPVKVGGGVGEAVDVVDADPVDEMGVGEFEGERVGGFADFGAFDADTDQLVDVEEAAVVGFASGDLPVGEAPGLGGEQGVELGQGEGGRVAAVWVEAGGVEARGGGVEVGAAGGGGGEAVEAVLHGPGGVGALGAGFGGAGGQGAQSGFGGAEGLHERVAGAVVGGERGGAGGEPVDAGGRVEGDAMLVVAEHEAMRGLVGDGEVAAAQGLAVAFAEHRQKDAIAGFGPGRVPVDVEPGGMARGLSVAEHVGPPGVADGSSHVIGHDVDEQADAMGAGGGGERAKVGEGAEARVETGGIGDVVAMGAARAGGGDG